MTDKKYPKGKLTVVLQSCENLDPADLNGKSDPFVEFNLWKNAKKEDLIETDKSTVKKKTLNPTWDNETFIFDPDHVLNILEIKVWDWDLISMLKKLLIFKVIMT